MKSISNSIDQKRLFQKLKNREKSIALVFLAALLIGLWLPSRIIVSTSASLKHRIFFLTNPRGNIKTGDYLVFRHKVEHETFVKRGLNKENNRLIKQVGCSPGEILAKDADNRFFCGKILLGKALTKDSEGRNLPQFNFIGPVPDNNYFMVGSNPRSFDSKYFGFIHADQILYKALPLW
ncbi:S26 family signal peptidase [Desulforhopalus sp. IMCC35007]|uniref:S26 family signal peptidase n=1 Tax=Desulforhopalus sp. IMCC35007 TaxID=2569543 RepID=UPI00145CBE94|nr:S26 family signal peptidase [Desulforhopalus sp. IMCC35007]